VTRAEAGLSARQPGRAKAGRGQGDRGRPHKHGASRSRTTTTVSESCCPLPWALHLLVLQGLTREGRAVVHGVGHAVGAVGDERRGQRGGGRGELHQPKGHSILRVIAARMRVSLCVCVVRACVCASVRMCTHKVEACVRRPRMGAPSTVGAGRGTVKWQGHEPSAAPIASCNV